MVKCPAQSYIYEKLLCVTVFLVSDLCITNLNHQLRTSACSFPPLEPQLPFRLLVLYYSAVHAKLRAAIHLEGLRDKSDRYYHPKTPFRLNLINSTFITRHRSTVYAGRSAESMCESFALMSL